MWRVLKHKGFSVFMATFVVVLLSGVALAQVSVLGGGTESDAGQAASIAADPEADWTGIDLGDATPIEEPKGDKPPAEEPKDDQPAEEPKDEKPPAVEPKEDTPPAEEPKDDQPAEEPKDEKPPAVEPKDDSVLLKITSPSDGSETEKKVVRVEGLTDHDAVVTMGKYQADRDAEGHWAIHLTLHSEKNVFPFRAEDKAGNVAEASLTVYYVGEPDKPDYEFTAHQKWEATDSTPPQNRYWGTASPGAKIWIVSHYGEKQVQAGPDGGWEATVVFEGAPHGERFKVVVESSDGGRAVFSMKVFYPEHEEKHEFTANQKYGSCGEEIPYDVFWGTATPGAKVWVESGHGGGMVYANDLGHWEIRVDFPKAPVGERFPVYVESNDGGFAEFKFVRTTGEHTA